MWHRGQRRHASPRGVSISGRLPEIAAALLATALFTVSSASAAEAPSTAKAKLELKQAERLQDAGFEAQARELVEGVARDSTVPIPAKLRSLTQRVGWWRDLLGEGAPLARLALEVLIVAAGALVLALLAFLLVFSMLPAVFARLRRTVRLAGFSGSSEATLTDVLGASLSATLARMHDDRSGRALVFQSGTEPKFELPKAITEAVPQAGVLAGLASMLGSLLYVRLYSVSGTVHPVHEHRGAGLTLTLAGRDGRTIAQETFWEQDFALKQAGAGAPEAVRYERLVLPATMWLAFQPALGFKPGTRMLGARDWRSYALFSLGEIVPDARSARVLYEQALDRDQGNLGARLNLAALLLQRPSYEVSADAATAEEIEEGSRESWQERVETAWLHLCAVVADPSAEGSAIWYRARYMQAIVCVYRAQAKTETDLSEAKRQAARALALLRCLREEMHAHGDDAATGALVDALRTPVEVLEQTARLLGQGTPDLSAFPPERWLSADGDYNLACLYSRYAEQAGKGSADFEARQVQAVRLLRRSIDRRESERRSVAIEEAEVDPAFDPIRDSPGFEAVLAPSKGKNEQPGPTRYAVTLDPGPVLSALAGVGSAGSPSA
jgi:hypothetical protein